MVEGESKALITLGCWGRGRSVIYLITSEDLLLGGKRGLKAARERRTLFFEKGQTGGPECFRLVWCDCFAAPRRKKDNRQDDGSSAAPEIVNCTGLRRATPETRQVVKGGTLGVG